MFFLKVLLLSNFIFYTDFPAFTPIICSSGSTLLHFAATNSCTNVVRTLLLHVAHTGWPNNHRVTPEMPACETGKERMAKVLQEWLANKNLDLTWLMMCMPNKVRGREGLIVIILQMLSRLVFALCCFGFADNDHVIQCRYGSLLEGNEHHPEHDV